LNIFTSFDLHKDSNIGLILIQGGHEGLQKSTAKAGVFFIKSYNYCKFDIYITPPCEPAEFYAYYWYYGGY
jgi:hypothetical protein